LLKQGQYVPQPVERQIVIIYAGTNGFIDSIPVDSIPQYEKDLFAHIDEKHPSLFSDLADKKEITAEIKTKLDTVLQAFSKNFVPSKA
jgi:F-type H+-transporting ATPase subunit alpha